MQNGGIIDFYIQQIWGWTKVILQPTNLKTQSWDRELFYDEYFRKSENFPHQVSIKNKGIRDTYDSDYKSGIERAAALSATKTHGVYQAPNVEESPFKTWDQLKKSNWGWNTIAQGRKILIMCKM